GQNPVSMGMGDFDGDGHRDVVVANDYLGAAPVPPSIVSLLLGNGDGTLQSMHVHPGLPGIARPVVADFDGDGIEDVASTTLGAPLPSVSLLRGHGDGSFSPPVYFDAGATPTSIASGDFNGDGRADLVAANWPSGQVSVLL